MKTDDLKLLLKTYKNEYDEQFLYVKDILEADFFKSFPKSDFSSSEYDSKNKEGTVSLSQLPPFFDTYHEYIERVISHQYSEKSIYLRDKGFKDVASFSEFYPKWLDFFGLISEHHYQSSSSSSKVIVIVDGSGLTESLDLNFKDLNKTEIEEIISNISDPTSLLESCTKTDAHQNEKLSVLRTSVAKWLKDNTSDKLTILNNISKITESFHVNYETYLRSFSFDEFIKDLEDDVSSFINSVEEQIQGYYIQALAVPGTVILASALRSAATSINLALLFSSGLALLLVHRSLKAKTKFISRISSNTRDKLDIYKKRTDDIKNSYARKSIEEKVSKAIDQINDLERESTDEISRTREIIWVAFVTYIIFSLVF